MPLNPNGVLGRLLHQRALSRWKAAARGAEHAELGLLRAQWQQARQLRAPLQQICHVADSRLALPRIGSKTFARPVGTDWSWRPQAWRAGLARHGIAPAQNKMKLGDEVTVFHDCKQTEISLRQQRNLRDDDLAPFGLSLEVFTFDGSFLSLVIEIPPDSCEGLQRRHLIRLATVIECEKPIKILTRLNVKHGPNTEQVLLTLPSDGPDAMVEFDLGYSQLNEKRAERMWIDLMFENPHMNQITLRDLTVCRYPRAEL